MGETNPTYPVREVAIALENAPDNPSGAERKKKGDIVAIRASGEAIGAQEGKRYLWLRIEGLEENEMSLFTQQVREPTFPTGEPFDKRRYCVPLGRVQTLYPSFNMTRALDSNDFYQPFVLIDSEDFSIVTADAPWQVSGLVFDKATGDYL